MWSRTMAALSASVPPRALAKRGPHLIVFSGPSPTVKAKRSRQMEAPGGMTRGSSVTNACCISGSVTSTARAL
ncbi:hypothetical protein FB451DRAFT_1293001 [Mycena latifolia]|nr:hypothetical protein FB451DRAFT_1293001 [Mycena latifolia]